MFGRLAATALIGAAMTGAAAAEVGSPRKLSAGEVLTEAKQNGLVVGPAIVDEDLDLGRLSDRRKVQPSYSKTSTSVAVWRVLRRSRSASSRARSVPSRRNAASGANPRIFAPSNSAPHAFARLDYRRRGPAWNVPSVGLDFRGRGSGARRRSSGRSSASPVPKTFAGSERRAPAPPPISPKRHSRAPLASITRRSGQRRVSTARISRRAHASHARPPRRP